MKHLLAATAFVTATLLAPLSQAAKASMVSVKELMALDPGPHQGREAGR